MCSGLPICEASGPEVSHTVIRVVVGDAGVERWSRPPYQSWIESRDGVTRHPRVSRQCFSYPSLRLTWTLGWQVASRQASHGPSVKKTADMSASSAVRHTRKVSRQKT